MKRDSYEHHSSGGVGFVGLLTVAFIVLKLTGVIDWSWWWVLSPIWISIGIAVVMLAVFIIIWLIADHYSQKKFDKKKFH